jgi:hypothetical protein
MDQSKGLFMKEAAFAQLLSGETGTVGVESLM